MASPNIRKQPTHNSFWVVASLLSTFSVVVWIVASKQLDTRIVERAETINSSFDNGQRILSSTVVPPPVRLHPNAATGHGMHNEIQKLSESVAVAWRDRYKSQRAVMRPTKEVSNLSDELDSVLTHPNRIHHFGKIPAPIRQIYHQNIESSMPRICSIIGETWIDFQTPGQRSVCVWSQKNQLFWKTKLTRFLDRDDQSSTNLPTTSQLFAVEEDLKLMEGLFSAIRQSNSRLCGDKMEMIKSNDLAKIKRLDYVLFGREAIGELGELEFYSPKANTRIPQQMLKRKNRRQKMSAFHLRYVTKDFVPITDNNWNSETDSIISDMDNSTAIRRVPVRFGVRMDERKIADFVAHCENGTIQYSIRQIRINQHDPNEDFAVFGYQNENVKESTRHLAANVFNSEPETGSRGNDSLGPVETRTSYMVDVEFQGFAILFNPVDSTKLK